MLLQGRGGVNQAHSKNFIVETAEQPAEISGNAGLIYIPARESLDEYKCITKIHGKNRETRNRIGCRRPYPTRPALRSPLTSEPRSDSFVREGILAFLRAAIISNSV